MAATVSILQPAPNRSPVILPADLTHHAKRIAPMERSYTSDAVLLQERRARESPSHANRIAPTRRSKRPGARSGDRTHMALRPRDFKSLAYTSSAIRARGHGARSPPQTKIPAGAGIFVESPHVRRTIWRPRSELNRRTRICSPLHNHSATRPVGLSDKAGARRRPFQASHRTKPRQAEVFCACILERETRLELATSTLARLRSTN